MFEKKNRFATFLWSFGAGLVTGAAIALVFTPITGRKFQKKLAEVTEKVAEKVEDMQTVVRKVANA